MSKLPLVEGVLKYVDEDKISFCMPGHKGGRGFLSTSEGKRFFSNIIKMDLTEVDGIDNLHKPEGIIKESLIKLAKLYKSKKSYFLVNGSTSGNLTMIFSSFNEGDKIIVERNCHKSIFNAIIMRKLQPIYIKSIINKEYNAPISVDMEHFLCLIKEHKDAKGILITYPNYYGICSDLKAIIMEAKKYDMKVLVDSAHGAHFGICDGLPESALALGADMVVMSSHKTLASLTQTAYLHIGHESNVDIEKVDFYVNSFLSTSPSYMLMCSMDYGRYFLEEHGKDEYNKLLDRANRYRNCINKLDWLHVLGEEDIADEANYEAQYSKIDLSRYVINIKEGYSAYKLYEYLRNNNIQAEMCDGSNVVLIFSPFNYEEDFKTLYEVLIKCSAEDLKGGTVSIKEIHIPQTKFLPFEVLDMKKIKISIDESEGKICGLAIVPYPPGIPIINAGEVIDNISIRMIKYYLENNISILGLEQNKVTIIEN